MLFPSDQWQPETRIYQKLYRHSWGDEMMSFIISRSKKLKEKKGGNIFVKSVFLYWLFPLGHRSHSDWNTSRLILKSHGIFSFLIEEPTHGENFYIESFGLGFVHTYQLHCSRDFKYSETLALCDRVNSGLKCNMRISCKKKWERSKRSGGVWSVDSKDYCSGCNFSFWKHFERMNSSLQTLRCV